MAQTAGSKKQIIGIVVVVALAAVAILVVAQYVPSKFFNDTSHAGIGLVRDDKEMGVYYNRVGYALDGGIPYKYSRIEYPPLGVFYLTIPAIFFKTFASYRAGLMALNILTFLALLAVTYYLLSMFGRNKKILWLFVLPSFVYFVLNRFDVLPALLTQVALLLLLKKRFGWSFFVLSLLFLAKGYAIVLFPIFFLYYINQKQIQAPRLLKNRPLMIFIVPIVLVTAITCIVAGFMNGMFPYVFQSTRFFGVGTIYVPYYLAIQEMLPVGLFNAGASILAKVFSASQLIVPIFLYIGWSIFRKFITTKEDVLRWSVIILMLYILCSVYYSPQWFVWLLPLLLLVIRDRAGIFLVIAYDIVNYLQFPVFWHYFGPYAPALNMIVVARTILFVWLLGILVWRTIRSIHQPSGAVVI
jgi:hypothetical protein